MWGRNEHSLVRRANHSGSWYTDDAEQLSQELEGWLKNSGVERNPLVKAIIAPHAGYRYSGRCAAYAFGHIEPSQFKRIFLLGPSHHHFTKKCAVTKMTAYQTPLGDLPVDVEVCAELKGSGLFDSMSRLVDEAEHSMEMHLPYLWKAFEGHPVTVVPILVGGLSPEAEAHYGQVLAPYMEDPLNFFSISSDFCHWGSRFNYQHYEKSEGPIYKSIEALDRCGMGLIEGGDPSAFTEYLSDYENTICGRHPIGVLMHILKNCKMPLKVKFVKYEQSSQCKSFRDSSVSYASAIAAPLE